MKGIKEGKGWFVTVISVPVTARLAPLPDHCAAPPPPPPTLHARAENCGYSPGPLQGTVSYIPTLYPGLKFFRKCPCACPGWGFQPGVDMYSCGQWFGRYRPDRIIKGLVLREPEIRNAVWCWKSPFERKSLCVIQSTTADGHLELGGHPRLWKTIL